MKTWLHKSSFCRQISDQNQKSLGTTRGVHKTTVQCEVQCACYKLFFIFEIINVWNTKGVYFGVVVLESIPVSIAWRDKEHFYSPLDDMLVHCRINTHPPPLPHLFRLWYTTYLFSGVKGEDYCGSMVSCPGTQHDKPLRAWKLPESHRLTKTQQFSLVCVCSQVSVSIHSLCRCSDTYSYINGEKMVNFLVCESVFFFFATVEPPAPVINFSYIPFKLINLRETKDFIHVIKVQLLYNMQLRFCVGSIINRFQLKDLSRCKILESLEMKI